MAGIRKKTRTGVMAGLSKLEIYTLFVEFKMEFGLVVQAYNTTAFRLEIYSAGNWYEYCLSKKEFKLLGRFDEIGK